jgi:hypothetical protein
MVGWEEMEVNVVCLRLLPYHSPGGTKVYHEETKAMQ